MAALAQLVVRETRIRALELADPLLLLERGHAPERPLPPFFAPCGTWDVLIDDTRRLATSVLTSDQIASPSSTLPAATALVVRAVARVRQVLTPVSTRLTSAAAVIW